VVHEFDETDDEHNEHNTVIVTHIDNFADEDDCKDMIDEIQHDIINALLVVFDEVDEVLALNEV
jgi:hypothetical protein